MSSVGSGGTYTIFKISSGTLTAGSTKTATSVNSNYNFRLESDGTLMCGGSSTSLSTYASGSGNPTFSVTFPPNYILLSSVALADGTVTGMTGELVETTDDVPSTFANLEFVDLSLSISPTINNLYTGYDSGISVTITPECGITGYNNSGSGTYLSAGKCFFTYKVTVYILAEYVPYTDL